MTVKPVLENTAFILICRVRGKPRPRIYWTLNGHNVFESPHVTTETFSVFAEGDRRGLLVRGASRKIKHGIYKCVAANNWGIVESRGIKVDIKGMASETSTNIIGTHYPVWCHACTLYYLRFQYS